MKRSVFKSAIFACVIVAILSVSMIACFADSAEAVSAVQGVFTDVTGTINIASIVSMLGIAVGACVGLVLMWFGLRKVIRIIMAAFRKGKISV